MGYPKNIEVEENKVQKKEELKEKIKKSNFIQLNFLKWTTY